MEHHLRGHVHLVIGLRGPLYGLLLFMQEQKTIRRLGAQ